MTTPSTWNATYRLQLTPDFGFDAAADIVDYLQSLGISHLYLSPIFEARPGSTHGYDQTDPTRIRGELGGKPAFERLADAARKAGIGILLDIVPNHMAAHHANPWWFGLLRYGPGSEYDRFFDVDWESGDGRIVLPVLGAPLAEVIANGELVVEMDESGGRRVRYFDKLFPLRVDLPATVGLTNPDALRVLLSKQHFDLMFWRDGLRRINYRRFFDISDLAGIRVEDPLVFEALHAKVLELVSRGQISGLRLDHIDGLRDPLQYLSRLRRSLDAARPESAPIPVFVEKILARGESLPKSWPVDGTTGYEFLAASTALMTESNGVAALRQHAIETGAGVKSFGELATDCKREAAESILKPELARVCRVAETCLQVVGLESDSDTLRRVLTELSVCMPGYRIYADDWGLNPEDLDRIRSAANKAGQRISGDKSGETLEHLMQLLTLSGPFRSGDARELALNVLRLWQQFTGPLAAKGIEDTALYRDIAFLALNDVGTEPVASDHLAAIHLLARQRDQQLLALNATDTHDAKRSEDVRARLAVLSQNSQIWVLLLDEAIRQVSAHASGGSARSPNAADLSLLIHSAFALWPENGSPDKSLADRVTACIIKSAREAKTSTSWTSPNTEYESACRNAVDGLLFSDSLAGVRAKLAAFAIATRPTAAHLSIASVLLKSLFPGTPDWYQGAECRVLSLVDPDNRRPVDFGAHQRLLAEIRERWKADPPAAASEFLQLPDSDRAKLFVTWRALAIRRRLLADGMRIVLASCDATPTQWRWTVTAGEHRCLVAANLLPESNGNSPARPAPDRQGLDQISARPPGTRPLWASVVVEGVTGLL